MWACRTGTSVTLGNPPGALRVEHEIRAWATQSVKVVPQPVAECPSEVPIKVGSTFACTVSGGGRTIDLEVTIRDKKGDVTFHIV